jgi:hypothetical protein
MSLNEVGTWSSKAIAVLIGMALVAPLSAMTRRPTAYGRYLSCAVEVQTLPGAGGFVPRMELFNSGPLIPSGTAIRYRPMGDPTGAVSCCSPKIFRPTQ